MNRISAILALCAATPFASADFFKCDLQVSADNGVNWGDNAVVPVTGGEVKVRFLLSAERTAGMVSIAGTQIYQIDLANPSPLDLLSHFAPPIAYANPVTTFKFKIQGSRIVRDRDPFGQIVVGQFPLNPRFTDIQGVADNPWDGGSFVYNVAASGVRTINLSSSVGANGMNIASVYTTATGSNSIFPESQMIFDGATITVIPAPASAMLLGLAGLGASRRRR